MKSALILWALDVTRSVLSIADLPASPAVRIVVAFLATAVLLRVVHRWQRWRRSRYGRR